MTGYSHIPVLVAEVLQALRPRPGGRYVDGTIGGGGHAAAILSASEPDGFLYACDVDGEAVKAAAERLAEFAGRWEIRRGGFAQLADWVPRQSCDGALLDLGVSSAQLDTPERGFSFQNDGPLDMRMDDRQELTAAHLVNQADERELARIAREWGDERQARRLAQGIVRARRASPFTTTGQLAGLIARLAPRRGKRVHPATRLFQALRMSVNDEIGSLAAGLPAVWSLLKPGGRLAVIAFHSIEARMVKDFGRALARNYRVVGETDLPAFRVPRVPELRLVNRKPIRPGPDELAANPRARSAQLRVFEKI